MKRNLHLECLIVHKGSLAHALPDTNAMLARFARNLWRPICCNIFLRLFTLQSNSVSNAMSVWVYSSEENETKFVAQRKNSIELFPSRKNAIPKLNYLCTKQSATLIPLFFKSINQDYLMRTRYILCMIKQPMYQDQDNQIKLYESLISSAERLCSALSGSTVHANLNGYVNFILLQQTLSQMSWIHALRFSITSKSF